MLSKLLLMSTHKQIYASATTNSKPFVCHVTPIKGELDNEDQRQNKTKRTTGINNKTNIIVIKIECNAVNDSLVLLDKKQEGELLLVIVIRNCICLIWHQVRGVYNMLFG